MSRACSSCQRQIVGQGRQSKPSLQHFVHGLACLTPKSVCLQLHSAPALSRVAAQLSQELATELKTQTALQRLQGMLEPIIAASLGRSGVAQL